MTTPSSYFNLSQWKLTLPVDATGGILGTAAEITKLIGYENAKYFYDDPLGGMVFRAAVDGATTANTHYARSELREMTNGSSAAWTLKTGGSMSGSLAVNQAPTLTNGTAGKIVVAQIHGQSDELVRLYWNNGTVYFVNDHGGPNNTELRIDLRDADGNTPKVDLNERFSYTIDAHGKTLVVKVVADGHVYASSTTISDAWQSDQFYFKAGAYLGVNETQGKGTGQVTYYGLDFNHTQTAAAASLFDGTTGADTLVGSAADDIIKGHEGNDVIRGGAGADTIEGNDGNDFILGGNGADLIKGGNGADTFVWSALSEGGDTIKDFRAEDKLDISALLPGLAGGVNEAFSSGYVRLVQSGADVHLDVDADGAKGPGGWTTLATLSGVSASSISKTQLVLKPSPVADLKAPASLVAHDGDSGNNTIKGTDAAEALRGFDGNDTLKGGGGNDWISGGAGNDNIEGNDGNDTLIGGLGADRLKGGAGADTFVWNTVKEGSGDHVVDFSNNDHIDLSALLNSFSQGAEQAISEGYLRFVQSGADTRMDFDADGHNGPGTWVAMATFDDTLATSITSHQIIDHILIG